MREARRMVSTRLSDNVCTLREIREALTSGTIPTHWLANAQSLDDSGLGDLLRKYPELDTVEVQKRWRRTERARTITHCVALISATLMAKEEDSDNNYTSELNSHPSAEELMRSNFGIYIAELIERFAANLDETQRTADFQSLAWEFVHGLVLRIPCFNWQWVETILTDNDALNFYKEFKTSTGAREALRSKLSELANAFDDEEL